MKRPTCIDLFSGAGGFSAGFRDAGFDVLGGVESTPRFVETHSLNFDSCKTVCDDITQLAPEQFSEVTGIGKDDVHVIIGSPPCKTFSTIGVPKIQSLSQQDIKTDPRNYLFKHFLEYVRFFNPAVFVMENVPSMKTRFKGELFANLVHMVDEIGYEPHVETLNAVHFGVPQSRRRLFVVGTRRGQAGEYVFPVPDFREPENGDQLGLLQEATDLESPRTVYDALSDLPRVEDGNRVDWLPYSANQDLTPYQRLMRNGRNDVSNNICRVSNDRAKAVFAHMPQGCRYMDLPPEVRQILPFREDIFFDRLKRLRMDRPSWTVLAHIGMDGYMYIHPTEDRTLSVREAARLQSFHDSFRFIGNMREQYIQVGNAVPPLLAQAIGDSVKRTIQ